MSRSKGALFGWVSGRAKSASMVHSRMITFGRGRSDVGAGLVHWYASVSKATSGNSPSSAAAIVLTAVSSAPIGDPSLLLIACSAALMHWL